MKSSCTIYGIKNANLDVGQLFEDITDEDGINIAELFSRIVKRGRTTIEHDRMT